MRALGIDPGFSGALCIVDRVGGKLKFIEGHDVPAVGDASKKRVDILALADWLESMLPIDVVVIEAVRVRSKMAATGMSNFLICCGYLEAMIKLAKFQPIMADPAAWKRKMGVLIPHIEGEKDYARQKRAKAISRAAALKLVPGAGPVIDRPDDHNRAEAILLAIYGLDQQPMV